MTSTIKIVRDLYSTKTLDVVKTDTNIIMGRHSFWSWLF